MKIIKKVVAENGILILSLSETLSSIGGSILFFFVGSRFFNTYNLCKDKKAKKIKNIKLPPELKLEHNDLDLEKIASKEYGECLVKFLNILNDNFSKEDLKNFYNNINSLKFKDKNFKFINKLFNQSTIAEYCLNDNEIKINKYNYHKSIYHELFHMASANRSDNYCGGFSQGNNNVGYGIDEGYTELLTKRYFVKEDFSSIKYIYLRDVSKKIEFIVGKEKMESLYMNANLLGLINELKLYSTEENVMKFIANMDFVYKYMSYSKIIGVREKLVNKALKEIAEFIVKTYTNKLIKDKERLGLSKEEFVKFIEFFIYDITATLDTGKNKFNITNYEEVFDWSIEELCKEYNTKPNDINDYTKKR